MLAVNETFWDRFWPKVDTSGECWEWIGAKRQGYGVIGAGGKYGKPVYAHRASYEMHHGEIPEGMVVMHDCDNRACVRPTHLRAGTQAENLGDMVKRGRSTAGRPRPWQVIPDALCPVCDKPFKPKLIRGERQKRCSSACANRHQAQLRKEVRQ